MDEVEAELLFYTDDIVLIFSSLFNLFVLETSYYNVHYHSSSLQHCKKSILCIRALGVRRICSPEKDFRTHNSRIKE